MRRLLLANLSLLLVLLLAPQLALASGNVLLPSSSGSGSSLPNLGISVSTPPAASNTAQPGAVSPPTVPASIPTPPPTPVAIGTTGSPSLPFPTSPFTPPATIPAGTAAQTPNFPVFNPNDIISPIDPETAKNLPSGKIPTRVIHQPDISSLFAQANKNLPYSLTLSLSGKSIFGAKDVEDISDKLGLNRSQIASACLLSATGLMQTDKGAYVLPGGAQPQMSVRYDGMIKNYLMSAQASCTADKLPPGSGFITQVGTRYIVPLQQIKCDAPKRQVTQIVITYNGSGSSQCDYQ